MRPLRRRAGAMLPRALGPTGPGRPFIANIPPSGLIVLRAAPGPTICRNHRRGRWSRRSGRESGRSRVPRRALRRLRPSRLASAPDAAGVPY